MIGLIILCVMLCMVSVFELLQIKMLWNELQAKQDSNKEVKEVLDIHTKWLNNMSDELREYTRILSRLP